jgi:hypothetical protein
VDPVRRCPSRDTGDIVLGWLTKLVVVLSVVGLIAFDGISIATARLSVEDQATAAAREASRAFQQTRNVQAAYDTAVATAVEADPLNAVPPGAFRAQQDGTVTLVVQRTATTLVLQHIKWIADWADVSGEGTGKDLS